MKKHLSVLFLALFMLLTVSFTSTADEVSQNSTFSYQPSGKNWLQFSGFIEDESFIDCLKIETDSTKSYYLSYRTYNEGKGSFYPYVTSIENDYAGVAGRRIQRLGIRVIDKSTGNGISEGVVVMYRVKTEGRWLPWVSNADPEWMYYVQRKYGITGVIDTVSGYAGLANGSFITGVEIRIFEEQSIENSRGESNLEKLIDAPFISQVGMYPTGCESVSAVMALQYQGLDITVDEFIKTYLEKGPKANFDPDICFGGDPYSSSGMGCWAPTIEKAVSRIPKCFNINVQTLYGKHLNQLCREYIDNNIPVLVWATVGMQTPVNGNLIDYNGKIIQWIAPEHCLLLVGYDEENYIFNDPLAGEKVYYSRSTSENAYCGLGMQAVVITADDEAHTEGELITVKEATVYEAGLGRKLCTVCGKVLYEEEIAQIIYFGDIDRDGVINGSDLGFLRKWILAEAKTDMPEYFDVNGDGNADIRDLMRIKRHIAGEDVQLGVRL